ncbi:hypothetical protein phiA019_0102 [Aeromonas phage phiA019]|nr:hypothetical protein phiA009_0105 [Aeromonas phage phiA009]ULG01639.1 hypothetical protein phiA019_0102 [Aeromonas phage phiA019]
MNRLESISQFYSDLVLGVVEASDIGYSVEEVSVTWAASMAAGALLKADGTWAAIADAASVASVLIDARVTREAQDFVVGTQYKLVVAKRALTLNKNLLKFSDGAINAAGVTALEAKGIKVTDKVVG